MGKSSHPIVSWWCNFLSISYNQPRLRKLIFVRIYIPSSMWSMFLLSFIAVTIWDCTWMITQSPWFSVHSNDVVLGTMASQITSLTIVYSTVYSGADQRKLRVTGIFVGNSPETGKFPAQMASNAENVSVWWRHHERPSDWRRLNIDTNDVRVRSLSYRRRFQRLCYLGYSDIDRDNFHTRNLAANDLCVPNQSAWSYFCRDLCQQIQIELAYLYSDTYSLDDGVHFRSIYHAVDFVRLVKPPRMIM